MFNRFTPRRGLVFLQRLTQQSRNKFRSFSAGTRHVLWSACKHRYVYGVVGGAVISSTLAVAACDAEFDARMWNRVWPSLEAGVVKFKEGLALPKRTWFYGKDQVQNDQELDVILDEALKVLRTSKTLEFPRKRIEELKSKIQQVTAEVIELRRLSITAQESSLIPGIDRLPFMWTKAAYANLIEQKLAIIDSYKLDIAAVKTEYGVGLKQVGLDVSSDAVDALLESVSGEDMIDMGVVFKNVKSITVELEHLTNHVGSLNSRDSLDVAEKYYGMYVVLLKVLNRMQVKFISTVDSNYNIKLQTYIAEAQAAISEAKASIKRLPPTDNNVKILTNNINSNEITLKVAHLYAKYLQEQRAAVVEKNKQLQRDLETALNTHKTVGISKNVSHLLHTGNQNFDALMNLTMPVIRVFDNEDMKKEFQGLSSRMKAK